MNANRHDVCALVLAAGSASRFGATKQLAELDGVPLVTRATVTAAAVCDNRVVLVVGHDWQAVAEAGLPDRGFLVHNDRYADGLGSSISQGARSLRHAAGAVLVLLADQPLVTAEHLRAVVAAWSGAGDEIVATEFDGSSGPPVLFARECFDDLANLTGDSGGKHLLSDKRFRTRMIRFDPAGVDIDESEDLKRISRSARS